ncbi:hypothetical protein Adeg_0704 [Ammonifex degensii KC4]|uniref:Uncharacterized protein n=1 Tax=Ammonifex degensii (strain DSM 10501 / KC4) TaxID=429009 RepID=C9RC74_AMMDK|nr:hypothetical protein [Ammonifex degensii]ACX51851.1 hypothetical protein Adeg_0704 [Ammonifex degensii KC4]
MDYASPLKKHRAQGLVRSLPGLEGAEVEFCYVADQAALLHPDTLRPLAYRAQAVVVKVPRPGRGNIKLHLYFVPEEGEWRLLSAAREARLDTWRDEGLHPVEEDSWADRLLESVPGKGETRR